MKQKNSPSHLNARRIRALERLRPNQQKERKILLDRILPPEEAASTRTKKAREHPK